MNDDLNYSKWSVTGFTIGVINIILGIILMNTADYLYVIFFLFPLLFNVLLILNAIFCIIGLVDIKKNNKKGKILSIIGLVISLLTFYFFYFYY